MRVQRWLAGVAVVAALAACQQDKQNGGDTRLNESDVPAGAIPADNGNAANPAAAGVPIDSTAAAPASTDSVQPVLGK